MENIKKIALIGISGSGKSIYSRRLGKVLNLPLIHMDKLFWKGNWREIPEKEYLIAHQAEANKPSWIIEGYIDEKMSIRLKNADLILYLDYSGIRCAWRVVKRWLTHRSQSRPELPKEAFERIGPSFLWMVLRRRERKDIERALEQSDNMKIIRFKSPHQAEVYLQSIN
jgi:adenylate kinase family enzyme